MVARKSSIGFASLAFFGWFSITAGWWALAFAPLPLPPVWLAEARAVCFGSLPNGLPDRWGWVLLILAPLSLLTFLLAVWGFELLSQLNRMVLRPAGKVAIGAMLGIGAFGVVEVGGRVLAAERMERAGLLTNEDEPLPAGTIASTEPAAAIALVDQRGEPFDLASLRGRPVFLTFAYGHCATVCPSLVHSVRRASEAYPGPPPPAVVVTLDPWRDTPSSLPTLFASWSLDGLDRAYLLSGTVEDVLEVVTAYGVGSSRDARTGEIAHPGMVFVLDPEGRLAHRFVNPPARWLVDAALALEPS